MRYLKFVGNTWVECSRSEYQAHADAGGLVRALFNKNLTTDGKAPSGPATPRAPNPVLGYRGEGSGKAPATAGNGAIQPATGATNTRLAPGAPVRTYVQGVKALRRFIEERESVRIKKEAGKPKPWTKDEILQRYKFCNMHREDDTVTKWIREHWRNSEQDNWFAMAVARWINWPDTLEEIGYPVPFDRTKVLSIMMERAARGEKLWTGAYVVATQGNALPKPQFIIEQVLYPLWHNRAEYRPKKGTTLAAFAQPIIDTRYQGSFMTGQLVADAKYCDPILRKASDWYTFAVSGPGSRRGLNRIVGRDVDRGWREQDWHAALLKLATDAKLVLGEGWHAQDLQNCLCEFDKYERMRLGEGVPRARYSGV